MMHMKRGNYTDQQPLLPDQNDDALLHVDPVMHPIPAPPYSTSIPMQPTTAINVQSHSAPSAVYVTTQPQPAACGGGSVFVLSQPVKPNPHCCLSIVSFLLCPMFGLIAWVFACCTNCENDRNNLEGAKCRSSCACGWAVTGIVLGLVSAVVLGVLLIGGFLVVSNGQPPHFQFGSRTNVVDSVGHAVADAVHETGDVANNAAADLNRLVNGNSVGNNFNQAVDQMGDAMHQFGDKLSGN